MFMIGKVDKKKQDLVAITKECLRRGLEAAQPWSFVGDIGAAVSGFAHKHGYSSPNSAVMVWVSIFMRNLSSAMLANARQECCWCRA